MIIRGKKTKKLNVVNLAEKINKNLKSLHAISSIQQEVPTSHKQQDQVYEQQNTFGLQKDRNKKEIMSSKFIYREQECR